jgi:transcriptional regulator with XRE-family HTH domain
MSLAEEEGMSVSDRFYEELGKAIRTRREALGLTQAELGARIELSRTSVTNLECGRQRLLIDQFCKLAEVLGCDREALLSAAVAAASADEPPMADLSSMPTVAEFVEKTLRSTESKQ